MKKTRFSFVLLGVLVCLMMLLLSACGDASEPEKKQGLKAENGNTYFYNDDGTLFTGGYKEVTENGKTDYYFFKDSGAAFTSGYKAVKIGNEVCYFYFEEDGKAFTGGLKQVTIGAQSQMCFFKENGRAVVSDFAAADGATYYFQETGFAAKDTFLTVGNDLYYFDATGAVADDGWFCLDEAYYYASATGALSRNTVVEGYKLDGSGKSITKYRIRELSLSKVNDTMTDQEKIYALYRWVLTNDMGYIRTYEHTSASWVWKDSWVDDMATSQMDQWGGNCFRYAAFLGMLIREGTGLSVTVYHGDCTTIGGGTTPHGWITVEQDGKWYIYDVELQKHADVAESRCYKVLPSNSTIHLNGVGTNLF